MYSGAYCVCFWFLADSTNQGCKRDLFFRDRDFQFWLRDETETFFEMSQTVQHVKFLASNCYKLKLMLCFVHLLRKTVQYQQLFYRNFRAIFPKTVSNLKKTPLLYIVLHSCTMYYLIIIFSKNKKFTNWSSYVKIAWVFRSTDENNEISRGHCQSQQNKCNVHCTSQFTLQTRPS